MYIKMETKQKYIAICDAILRWAKNQKWFNPRNIRGVQAKLYKNQATIHDLRYLQNTVQGCHIKIPKYL